MKRIGLLGGMSWQSSIEYERTINRLVHEKLGGVASADLIIRSFNFQDIEDLQSANEWERAGELLAKAAKDLERSGAQAIALCTNTMHLVAPQIEAAIDVPFLHIADATAAEIQASRLEHVALLGTKFTMEQPFYRERLNTKFGIESVTPNLETRNEIHRIIYEELVNGRIFDKSREFLKECIAALVQEGAQGVIAGCTEIELLVKAQDIAVPYFPTSYLHAKAIADFALES